MYKKYSERIDKLSAVFASGTLGRKGNEKKKYSQSSMGLEV